MKEILRSRRGTVQQQENVASVLDIVDQVQKRLRETMNSMKEQLEGIVNTLTPEQQVHFLSGHRTFYGNLKNWNRWYGFEEAD